MKKDAVPDLAAVREELDRLRAARSRRQPISPRRVTLVC